MVIGMKKAMNDWDGFDGAQIVYDDGKEKKYQQTIWQALGGIAAIMLLILAFHHIQELYLVCSANFIEAKYYEKGTQRLAVYTDEAGRYFSFNIDNDMVKPDGDIIRLYYKDDISTAVPVSLWSYWLRNYTFFGAILIVSLWRLFRIYRPKQYD